jgi:peptidoglycan/xylan/chitin deacetylase (PgdA/CDA1 family)
MTAEHLYAPASPAVPWRPTPLVAGSMGLHGMAALGALVVPGEWPWALAAVAANHAVLGGVGMWPRSGWLGPNITRLPRHAEERGEIAITLDDGPDPDVTPRVLELLASRGATATFFCIGERARRLPDLCREMVRQGHGVENHSRRHLPTFALRGIGGIRSEVAAAQESIAQACGTAPRFFRAPAGIRSPLLDPVLHEMRLRLTSWTRRGFDTREQPDAVAVKLIEGLRAGDILLLHDGRCARTPSGTPVVLEVLPRLLDAAAALGLRTVTLSHGLDS